jgi:NAD+ synthase
LCIFFLKTKIWPAMSLPSPQPLASSPLLLALAQLNPTVGNIDGNLQKLRLARREASRQGAHLLMTAELYLSGYPPEDLVLKPSFQKSIREAVETLAHETGDGGPAILLGTPWVEQEKVHNAVLLLADGAMKSAFSPRGPCRNRRCSAA